MKISHCMFDFDGTLVYTLDDIVESLRVSFAKNGIPLQQMDMATVMQLQLREAIAACVPGIAPDRIDAVVEDFKACYDASDYPATRLMAGAQELLEELRGRNIGMSIVSNKRRVPMLKILDKFGLAGYFQAVYNPDMFADGKKPSKTGLIAYALQENRLTKETTAYIGDSEIDVVSAEENGLISIIIENGYGNARNFPRAPAYILDNLTGILPLIGA